MTKVHGEWIGNEATQSLMRMFASKGHSIFFVGGCVRNALLGEPISDLDMATDALPETTMQLATADGLKAVPTGIEHGTITIITGDIPHEITTFRSDIATDGRHANVQFGTAPAEDAKRRDFTMNALYADSEGAVHDFVGGLEDLQMKRIRFIGDPEKRITEDYLRILRFFRFFAWYGNQSEGLDQEGLAACAKLSDGLSGLSAERIGAEMKKLLSAPDPSQAIAAMAHAGILSRILPGSDPKALAPLIHLEEGLKPDWTRRAVVLGGISPTVSWRLSRSEARAYGSLRIHLGSAEPAHELAYRLGRETARSILLCRAALFEQPLADSFETDLTLGSEADFPVKADDLMPEYQGKALGDTLRELEVKWIESQFALTRVELLASLKSG